MEVSKSHRGTIESADSQTAAVWPLFQSPTTYQTIATGRTLGGGSIGDAVAAGRIEAEQLGADSFVLKAGGSAAVTATLRVQREQRTGQGSAQCLILVRGIM